MTSFIPNSANPFLKDYSSTTLLKRNYQVIKQSKLLMKKNQHPHQAQIHHPKSNYSIATASTENPFQKKSLDSFNLINEKRNAHYMQLSQARSLQKSSEKSSFYKGLQDIGTKELWKSELEKQARYLLKQYGSQTLRYQYHPQQKYVSQISQNNQKTIHQHLKLPEKSRTFSNQRKNSKFSYEKNNHTPTFNRNFVTSQYYGYDQGKHGSHDNFCNQRCANNAQHQRNLNFLTDRKGKNKSNQRHSCYEEIIVEDRNQDLQTTQNLNKLQLPQESDARKSKLSTIYDPKQTSIENIHINFHNDQSMLSNFGATSEMYQSGTNFRMRFGHKKQGPLNIKSFDEDNKSEQWQNDQSISRQNIRQYPDQLQYDNKIYHMISL